MSKKDYIEAINEINADENLKNNTLQKMKDVKKKNTKECRPNKQKKYDNNLY